MRSEPNDQIVMKHWSGVLGTPLRVLAFTALLRMPNAATFKGNREFEKTIVEENA